MSEHPTIAILGASGLIGETAAIALSRLGFPVVPFARKFTQEQQETFGSVAIVSPIVPLEARALARLLDENKIDIVVNCIGVLQDGPRGSTETVHRIFAANLVAALKSLSRPILLVQLSIPGDDDNDNTAFSRTKRAAEHMISDGNIPFVILRPGFVVAPAAYGGSALIRALAALPFDLPAREENKPFAVTDVRDIVETIAFLARRWEMGEKHWRAVWDVMARETTKVGDVIDAFRKHIGGPARRIRLWTTLMDSGACAGDIAAFMGWSPPIRSTALREMRRGILGRPEAWINATGIKPVSLAAMVQYLPSTVQERWFARLYLTKALIFVTLSAFWIVSAMIAFAAFNAAAEILIAHGFSLREAKAITVISTLADLSVGAAISFRKTCRAGLFAGIALSLFYMANATIFTPDVWLEPLGALVKTGPAIILMLVALAILDDR